MYKRGNNKINFSLFCGINLTKMSQKTLKSSENDQNRSIFCNDHFKFVQYIIAPTIANNVRN